MNKDQAISIVVQHVVADIVSGHLDWALYPDIGENDWAEIVRRAEAVMKFPPNYREAYNLLASLANPDLSDEIADELRSWGNSCEGWSTYHFGLGNRAAERIESLQAELAEVKTLHEHALVAFKVKENELAKMQAELARAQARADRSAYAHEVCLRTMAAIAAERDAARAVIERVRAYVTSLSDAEEYFVEAHHRAALLEILDTAPRRQS